MNWSDRVEAVRTLAASDKAAFHAAEDALMRQALRVVAEGPEPLAEMARTVLALAEDGRYERWYA